MLRCTYIVLIHNDEENILNLVESLKKVEGNFRKEFIFVDDGSSDESLAKLKLAVNDLPRTTIITQENQGPAISINKASSLATGDYIHFVEGTEVLHMDSTALLIEACLNLGTQVAIGAVSLNPTKTGKIEVEGELIDLPLKAILADKFSAMRGVGKSGSLIHSDLLEKIDKADSSIYTQNMSLSLKSAKHTKFSYISEPITQNISASRKSEGRFTSYNNLKSIYNFAKNNPELFSGLTTELLVSLSHELQNRGSKSSYWLKSLSSKYFKSVSLKKVLAFYKQEYDRLF